jgi:hypothetical protein
MKKAKAAPAPPDSVLREIVESPEYRDALRSRILAGKATASEIGLARSIGETVKLNDGDDDARDALDAMDTETRRCLTDMIRMSLSPDSTRLRLIRAGSIVGVGYDKNPTPVPRPERTATESPSRELTTEELLP